MQCRICLEEEGDMIQPCKCKGSTANVHPECLERWLEVSQKNECEICKHEYEMNTSVEFKWTLCPSCDCKNTSFMLFGSVLLFVCQTYALFRDYDILLVFLLTNVVQGVLVHMYMHRINPIPTLCMWKFCSTLVFILYTVIKDDWLYVIYDGSITLGVWVFSYLFLVYMQSWQRVTYIYYDEQSNTCP